MKIVDSQKGNKMDFCKWLITGESRDGARSFSGSGRESRGWGVKKNREIFNHGWTRMNTDERGRGEQRRREDTKRSGGGG